MDERPDRLPPDPAGATPHWVPPLADQPGRIAFGPAALIADTSARPGRVLIVESGLVAVVAGARAERGTFVCLLGPGAVIGPDVASATAAGLATAWRALSPVRAHSVSEAAFEQALHAEPALRRAYMGHLEGRLIRSHQIAACNARHSLPARAAHWLLVLHHWLGDVLPVTHALLATILGARRAGVGVALQALQHAGGISQARGCVRILNLAPLLAAACTCTVRAHRGPDLLALLPALGSAAPGLRRAATDRRLPRSSLVKPRRAV